MVVQNGNQSNLDMNLVMYDPESHGISVAMNFMMSEVIKTSSQKYL